MNLTIVIPAYNEEEIILQTLESLKKYISYPHEIIVVNDCSTDKTEKVVKVYMEQYGNIKLTRTKPGARGFANALKLGFGLVKNGAVVPVMADLCDDPRTINLMHKKIQEGWDIVCGSRYVLGGSKKGGSKLQNLLSTFVCITLHYLTGIPTKDVSNAFKMYRKETLHKIKFNPCAGVEASMEITLQAYFSNAKITDVPTRWVGRKIGKSKFKVMQRTPRYLRIYLWALKNSLKKRLGLKLCKFYA